MIQTSSAINYLYLRNVKLLKLFKWAIIDVILRRILLHTYTFMCVLIAGPGHIPGQHIY